MTTTTSKVERVATAPVALLCEDAPPIVCVIE